MQLSQTSRIQHTTRARLLRRPQHVGRVNPNRPRRTIRQLHHEQQYAVPSLERLRREQPPEQRMRPGDDSDLTRQNRTKMLQSVALTSGTGKTHLASALGHIAIRRRISVHFARADKLFTRLRAARLDNTLDTEMRRLARVELLILDDFALRPLDPTQTSDFYELIVERHRKASTICTSNREPAEWLTMMSDPLLAQSAVDQLTSGAHTLIIEGPSYRQRQHPSPRGIIDPDTNTHNAH